MKRKVKEKRLEICCLEMYSTSKCMESGTTINRGNENLFDDVSTSLFHDSDSLAYYLLFHLKISH